jgi:hypothetical protein
MSDPAQRGFGNGRHQHFEQVNAKMKIFENDTGSKTLTKNFRGIYVSADFEEGSTGTDLSHMSVR